MNSLAYEYVDKDEPAQFIKKIGENTRSIEGKCLECDAAILFTLSETFYKKYGGQIREVITELPCPCGSHLWLISIPPKNTTMDDVLGDECASQF